jgi:hypothetical protein
MIRVMLYIIFLSHNDDIAVLTNPYLKKIKNKIKKSKGWLELSRYHCRI